MQLNKELLILAGFIALFLISYATGWFCDKNFRLVMRKTKLSAFKRLLFHFRDSKMKENKGHSVVCVGLERLAFADLFLGAGCFAAVKFTGNTVVFLGSAALMAASFGLYVFQLYTNVPKYKARKKELDKMDETGFEDYRSAPKQKPVQSEAVRVNQYPNIRKDTVADSDGRIDSMESGRELLKKKGLLDDDIFSPFVSDVTDKFTGEKIMAEFSDESDIEIGKAALEDLAGKQLKTDAYSGVNRFEESRNTYSKPAENKNTPVRKDDNE